MADSTFKIISDYHEEKLGLDDIQKMDIRSLNDNQFHILQDNSSYKVSIEKEDKQNKTYDVVINGNTYSIQIQDEYDLLIEKMGLDINTDQKVTDIAAPMPGLILDIMVKDGDSVEKGDPILILEAMKMENVIKAAGEGVVQKVIGVKGKAVDKGEIIIEMEK